MTTPDTIEDKLRETLLNYASIDDNELGEDKFNGTHNVDEAIAQIKQAFTDDNWYRFEGKPLLTGQAFYDRFEAELAGWEYEAWYEGMLDSARRAAGLDTEGEGNG